MTEQGANPYRVQAYRNAAANLRRFGTWWLSSRRMRQTAEDFRQRLRIAMPKARVRLSAGRTEMSDAVQALCFLAGANSIFYGEKLLTTGNPDVARDRALFERLGISPLAPALSNNGADAPHEHVHGPDCDHAQSPARPTSACNATRQR